MLHTQTVSASTLALIKTLLQDQNLQDFYLVGGTALALQLGHRESIDIDLFTDVDFDTSKIRDHLVKQYKAEITLVEKNTVLGFIEDVKIDLLSHKYPLLNPVHTVEGIRMISLKDIAAMKFNAIAKDGSRLKDFIDISCLLQYMPLQSLLNGYEEKYPNVSGEIVKRALLYHDDIDFDVEIAYMPDHEIKREELTSQLKRAVQFPKKRVSIQPPKQQQSRRKGRRPRF